ncbi:MAG: EthD domain-containing protein [bacterium]|nr:EthD domain-containing protein [bacterium]
MEKLAYLLWNDDPNLSVDDFRDRLIEELPRPLEEAQATRLKVSATDSDVAAGAGLHLGSLRPDALVTFWLECCQDRAPVEAALTSVCDRLAGYLVVESHPLRTSTPEGGVGQRMPGFSLVGCIEPKPGVDHETFVTTWERVHRDVAIAVQSTFSYVRNEVVRPLTDGAPPWGGIVEEGFPLAALEDPQAFYDAVGDDAKYQDHLKQMVDSCNAFLDMQKVDSHPMSEYRFY